MRRTAVFSAIVAIAAAGLLAPAAQARQLPGPPESYLFTVDGSNIKVIPGKDNSGKIAIDNPAAIRWSDRPYRHVLNMTVRELLDEFQWSPTTLKLADPTPNASVYVDGTSQIVDIRRARMHDGRLVLFVHSIDGPLTAASGPGSVVIDNVTTYPSSQRYTVDTVTSSYVSVTATSLTSVTVTSYTRDRKMSSVTLTPTSPSATLPGPLLQSVVEAAVGGATIGTTTYTAEAGFSSEGIVVNLYRPTTGGTLLVSTMNF